MYENVSKDGFKTICVLDSMFRPYIQEKKRNCEHEGAKTQPDHGAQSQRTNTDSKAYKSLMESRLKIGGKLWWNIIGYGEDDQSPLPLVDGSNSFT